MDEIFHERSDYFDNRGGCGILCNGIIGQFGSRHIQSE